MFMKFMQFILNIQIYLTWLLAQLTCLGAKYVHKTVSHVCDAKKLSRFTGNSNIVVNCSGLGALTLGGVQDKSVYPVRGQTVLVKNQIPSMILFSRKRTDAQPVYIFPRPQGGTILGGCR